MQGRHGAPEAEAARPHPRRPQAGEHHAPRPRPPAVQGQGHRLRLGLAGQQGRLQHVLAVEVLPRPRGHPGPALLRGDRYVEHGVRGRGALPRVAALPGELGVRSGELAKISGFLLLIVGSN